MSLPPTPTRRRRARPACHTSAVRDPSASADDESSHDSADELPPATSHGYAKWDFSGVPDPVMFQRFLGHSDDSSTGSYDPVQECFVVITNDQANAVNAVEAGDGEIPLARVRGQSRLLPRRRGGPTSMHNWLRHMSSRPSWQKSIARCSCFATPSLGKPLRAANVRASWAGKPTNASTPTSTSTTRTLLRERARSSSPPRLCYGPCPLPQHPRSETCTARRSR
jgi:hypothetical protein